MKSQMETKPDNSLNVDNFLNLIKYCNSKSINIVTINNKPVLYVTNKTAGLIENIPVTAILTSVLYGDPSNIMMQEIDENDEATSNFSLHITFLIVDYLASLPDSAFSGTSCDKLCVGLKHKLDYKEYAYYLTNTDLLISSRLYQWLDMHMKNNNEGFSFEYILSSFPHLLSEGAKEKILRLILILITLGFLKPCNDKPDNQSITQNSQNTNAITDKIDIAILIADNITRKNSSLTIRCKDTPYTLDIPGIQDQELVQGFLQNTLSCSSWEYITNNDTHDLSTTKLALLKLKLFAYIKLSSPELYENSFNKEDYTYIFSLMEISFAKNLPVYRASGMDILDIAILSLLQIKKFSLDEISTNISNYTLSEIHRSLFALLVMGLITVEKERSKEMNSVAAIIRRTLNQKSTRSLLHKLINSIKSK